MKPLSILVVDDHGPTRSLLKLWLTMAGHSTAEANNGHAAAAALGEREVHLVITDVLMPGGNGVDLIKMVRKQHPDVRVLAISGGGGHTSSASCLHNAQDAGAHALLLKPFQQDQLVTAMRYVMGAEEPADLRHPAQPRWAPDGHRREYREFPGLVPNRSAHRSLGSRDSD